MPWLASVRLLSRQGVHAHVLPPSKTDVGSVACPLKPPWANPRTERLRVQSRELSGLDEDWFIGFFRSSRLSRLYRVFAIGRRRARRLQEACKDCTHRQPAIFAIFVRRSKTIQERTQ